MRDRLYSSSLPENLIANAVGDPDPGAVFLGRPGISDVSESGSAKHLIMNPVI